VCPVSVRQGRKVDPNQAVYNPRDEQHRFASNAKSFVRLFQSEFPWVNISPTVVPHIFRHSGGINSGQHMGQVENIPTKANQRTPLKTWKSIGDNSSENIIQSTRRNRATGRDGGETLLQNFATIQARPRPETAQNDMACLQCCTRGGGTYGSLRRSGDTSSLPRTLASTVSPVLACNRPVELNETFF